MSKIHLYTTFYTEKKDSRRQELLTCLQYNLNNDAITTITIFNEGGDLSDFKHAKLNAVSIGQRPTYQEFITHINSHTSADDIHILANTDIYFDQNIIVLKEVMFHHDCYALSRWDTTEGRKPLLYNHNGSQDAWIFKGPIKKTLNADFPLGVPRCDNRFMFEIKNAGYKLKNPAFSIKAFHLHEGQRELVYTENDNIYKISKPYLYLYPHNLYGLWKTLHFNVNHKYKLAPYCYDIKKVNNWWPIRIIRKVWELITRKKMSLIGYK